MRRTETIAPIAVCASFQWDSTHAWVVSCFLFHVALARCKVGLVTLNRFKTV